MNWRGDTPANDLVWGYGPVQSCIIAGIAGAVLGYCAAGILSALGVF